MKDALLVELLTEELPPKALLRISQVFSDVLLEDLREDGFLDANSTAMVFATPRRIAVSMSEVLDVAPDRDHIVKGPSVKSGLDAGGKPNQALLKFAERRGVSVEQLIRINDGKQDVFAHRDLAKGSHLATSLELKIEEALKRLPIPKMMRWGDGDAQFVRPVHGLVMMHGPRVLPGTVLGLESSNQTRGHRFLSAGPITLKDANDYERALREDGKVIASFEVRRSEIVKKLNNIAGGGVELVSDDALLDEVTALVEAPTVYSGEFSPEFLAVPQECLILSMQQHQKYVPLRDKASGKLLPRFLFVSNLNAADPSNIIQGNERVLRARLSDAMFFYDQDRKTRLEARVPKLAHVVYHNKLGNQLERIQRLQKIAAFVAGKIGADVSKVERAAYLCKADLLTDMVGEFPELQGIMGYYYALADGEPEEICEAIGDQYSRRVDSDELGQNLTSDALCLAERAETLIGMWGIGLVPTGEKDPYGLRRAALDVVSVFHFLGNVSRFERRTFNLQLQDLLAVTADQFKPGVLANDVVPAVTAFVYERYRNQLFNTAERNIVDAVIALSPPLHEVEPRVRAVIEFRKLPEAASLAAANKRARNILRKEEFSDVRLAKPELLVEDAEIALAKAIVDIRGKVDAHYDRNEFVDCLRTLASVKTQVDSFFDKVLVNAEDAKLRENRLALLSELSYLFNKVADISKLAA